MSATKDSIPKIQQFSIDKIHDSGKIVISTHIIRVLTITRSVLAALPQTIERSFVKMSVGIKPINDYVLIKRIEAEEKTKSGIVLPSQAKEQPQIAEVLAVGPGTEEVKMVVKKGDKVIFGQYGGMELKFKNEDFKLVRQSDIYATVD